MKIALFLGAGASVPYGKPVTAKFKELLLNKYQNNRESEYLLDFLRNEKFEDIEHVLQSIKEIRNFLQGYGGKFFTSSTSPLQIRFQNTAQKFDEEFFKRHLETVEKIIQDEIFNYYRWDAQQNKKLIKVFNTLFRIFEPKDRIDIFTTNYDNAVETYCGITQKHKPIDGFRLNARQRAWVWEKYFISPDNDEGIDVFLHKLHGSLDWKQLRTGEIIKTHEESKPSDPRFEDTNLLIYPTLAPKEEESQEPFKSIIDRFDYFMNKTASICIVIGYSFRDHLNDTFVDFLNRGHVKLIIISPNAINDLHSNLLKEKIPEDKIENWKESQMFTKSYKTADGNDISRIHCIQKELEAETIEELMKDIKRCINDQNFT